MRKKLMALGTLLFIAGFLITVVPDENLVHVKLAPFSMAGILIGIVGITMAVIGFFVSLANRL